jgi:hypothetical protein
MMMELHESVDGITFAVQEIDDELRSHIPEIRRRVNNRCMVELGIDELLDMRNDLTSILGELVMDDYERMMTNG